MDNVGPPAPAAVPLFTTSMGRIPLAQGVAKLAVLIEDDPDFAARARSASPPSPDARNMCCIKRVV